VEETVGFTFLILRYSSSIWLWIVCEKEKRIFSMMFLLEYRSFKCVTRSDKQKSLKRSSMISFFY